MSSDLIHDNRDTEDRYGNHCAWKVPCNGFWLKDFDFTADPLQHEPRHDILAMCNGWYQHRGQAIDDMVWYNHGTKQFQRVKGAERVVEVDGRA